jgi:hypothetical protein
LGVANMVFGFGNDKSTPYSCSSSLVIHEPIAPVDLVIEDVAVAV